MVLPFEQRGGSVSLKYPPVALKIAENSSCGNRVRLANSTEINSI